MRNLLSKLILGLSFAGALAAQGDKSWTEPFPAHKVVGNVYYVGSRGLAAYLVTTPAGNILINSDLDNSPELIKTSVEKLGFKFSDTKILLISHAHWDHCAGSARIKAMTGAKYMVMAPDVPEIEDGGKTNFQYGRTAESHYPPTKVDRVLHDGDTVELGGTVLTARLTPGHTKGCTTWTARVKDGTKTYNVVIVGSPNVNTGYRLVNNAQYPQIASDYAHTFEVLKSLPCDVFLGAHGDYYDLAEKYPKLEASGGKTNAFIDPEGYKAYVAERQQAFEKELAKQKAAAK